MDKLVCVEYAPRIDPRSDRDRSTVLPLVGCIGETLERFLNRHPRSEEPLVPVRFPVSGPGSRISLAHSGRDPLDPHQLEVEAIDVKRDSLYIIEDRVPTSLYERVKICKPQELFERPMYMSTFSLGGLTSFIKQFQQMYRNCWIWKWDHGLTKAPKTSVYQPMFVEARVYGIDNVIGTYDARKFDGVALEIIYRPWPSQDLINKGTKRLRSCSNVYLFSNSEEYINYVDGVKIIREKTDCIHMLSKYGKFLSAKQSASMRKTILAEKQTKKDPAPPLKSPMKEAYTYAAVAADTSIQWGTTTNTGSQINLGTWHGTGDNK